MIRLIKRATFFTASCGALLATSAFAKASDPGPGTQKSTTAAAPSTNATAASSKPENSDIIVTATRKSQSILSVPLSITAVTGDVLVKKAAQNFFDYARSIPNLSFGQTGYGVTSARTIGIRGISDAGTTALYLDDTPVPESVDPKVVNLDRIEVLRGPQGTLYGARSEGGAVRLITIQPDIEDFSGKLHGQVSGTKNNGKANSQLDGVVNLPIAKDVAALRIVAIHTYDSGFITREFPTATGSGRVDNVGASKTTGTSASLLVKASDSLSFTPRFLYQKTIYNGFPYADVAVDNPYVTTILKPKSLTVQREFDIPESASDRYYLGSFDVKLKTELGTLTSSTSYFNRLVHNAEDNSLGAADAFGLLDENGNPITSVIFGDKETNHQLTEELRFGSGFQGPFQVITGVYYNREKDVIDIPPTIVNYIGGDGGPGNLYSRLDHSTSTEIAGYAEGTLNLTDKLVAIAGARVFHNTNLFHSVFDGQANGGLVIVPEQKTKQSGITPKASIQYKIRPDFQVYFTAAKGYRPGAAQPPIIATSCAAELSSLGLTSEDTAAYKADSIWSYEVGAKGSLLDHKISVAGAVFRVDWNNIQQTENLLCGYPFRTNAGSVQSQGGELEIAARPFSGFSLNAGFGYTDAKFTSGDDLSVFRKGDPVTQVPRYTIDVSGDYRYPFDEKTALFFHADYNYTSKSYSAVNAQRNPETGALVTRLRPGSQMVNLRAGLGFGQYEVAVFGKNITNEIASLSDVTDVGVEAPGRARVAVSRPRTIGIELSGKF